MKENNVTNKTLVKALKNLEELYHTDKEDFQQREFDDYEREVLDNIQRILGRVADGENK